jgi:hypothetical protein
MRSRKNSKIAFNSTASISRDRPTRTLPAGKSSTSRIATAIWTNFKDVVLRFNPAGGLKFLAEHAMGYEPKYHYKDVEPDKAWRPVELGYAPTALSVASPKTTGKSGRRKTASRSCWPRMAGGHQELHRALGDSRRCQRLRD